MPKPNLWVFCTVFVFAACTPARQLPQSTISPHSGIFLPRDSTQTSEPSLLASPPPNRTATSLPLPTFMAQPISTITPTITDSPVLSVDPSGQTIIFWHVWAEGLAAKTMVDIIKTFNETNAWGITVNAVESQSYWDLENAYYKSLETAGDPNLIVAYPNVLAKLWHEQTVGQLDQFFNHPQYGFSAEELADFYPATLDAGLYHGARVGFPLSQSANLIFYNRTWAKELGFQSAPTSAQDFKIQACTASRTNNDDADPGNDGTGGLVLYPATANILSWLYAFDGEIINPEDQDYRLSDPDVYSVAVFLKELVDQGCAFQTQGYPNPEFATRKALFTTSSSVGCQYQLKAFEKPGATSDDWLLIAFPGTSENYGTVIFPQMIGLVNKSPAQNLAAWLFLKYLASPETQSKWVVGSQYYPVRISAIGLFSEFSITNAQWASGLELLRYGRAEPTRPSWQLVRSYIHDTFAKILESDEQEIHDLLLNLDFAAIEAIAETE